MPHRIWILSDVAAYGAVIGSWAGWERPVLSLVAIIYLSVRLLTTKTAKKLFRKLRGVDVVD